ncbi:hypothetical protein [Bradyrhizobium sp. WSM1417]|uniref:hypothetical protein n=1 Tax=Bradyrhizobium sp. WSM1417 TaxID=754500 RepID=UPI0012EB2B4B|nr:hypothetical protein [Bradyrhizobium sp. WSM1417]
MKEQSAIAAGFITATAATTVGLFLPLLAAMIGTIVSPTKVIQGGEASAYFCQFAASGVRCPGDTAALGNAQSLSR